VVHGAVKKGGDEEHQRVSGGVLANNTGYNSGDRR
jgi:hypothetical protein